MKTTEPFRTKIGSNHGKEHSRIWIEGAHLTAAGFAVNDTYHRKETTVGLVLIHAQEEPGAYKVSGKGVKPIIDITGSIVARLFPTPLTHVNVAYGERVITITAGWNSPA